jgi:flagellar hook-length control protein FliK
LDLDSQGQNASSQNMSGSNLNAAPLSTMMDTKSANPYSFASQLSESRAANGGLTGLPTPIDQVIFQLSRNVKNGNDQMTLQMHPADLGRISVKLNFGEDGRVQGTVVADNPTTLHLLQKDSGSLERALQEAGLRADSGSLQFSLGGQSGSSSGQTAANSSNSSGTNDNTAASPTDTTLTADATTDSTETWYVTPGRVNIRV